MPSKQSSKLSKLSHSRSHPDPEPVPPPSVVSATSIVGDETADKVDNLPACIIINTRNRIEPEMIGITEIRKREKERKLGPKMHPALMFIPFSEPVNPEPKYPIFISWRPTTLCCELNEETVLKQVTLINRSDHLIYIALCGLWGDAARSGASWHCYPRTRLFLAPGMVGHVFVKVKPRESSHVQETTVSLQVAVSHLRDIVVGYFAIPIHVKFLNYVELCLSGADEGVDE